MLMKRKLLIQRQKKKRVEDKIHRKLEVLYKKREEDLLKEKENEKVELSRDYEKKLQNKDEFYKNLVENKNLLHKEDIYKIEEEHKKEIRLTIETYDAKVANLKNEIVRLTKNFTSKESKMLNKLEDKQNKLNEEINRVHSEREHLSEKAKELGYHLTKASIFINEMENIVFNSISDIAKVVGRGKDILETAEKRRLELLADKK